MVYSNIALVYPARPLPHRARRAAARRWAEPLRHATPDHEPWQGAGLVQAGGPGVEGSPSTAAFPSIRVRSQAWETCCAAKWRWSLAPGGVSTAAWRWS